MRSLLPRLVALALVSCSSEDSSSTPPNVLLVTLDTVRADHLSCYGRDDELTPSFDRLAADGARFSFCMSTSAVTPVSHATILSGRYPPGHRVRVLAAEGGYRLPDDVPTLTSLLKRRGYATAAVHSSFAVSGWFGFARDFDHFQSFDGKVETDEHGAKWDVQHQRRSDETSERVIALLDELPEPWFVWVHYWDPHDATMVPPEELLPAELPRHEGRPRPTDALYALEVNYVDRQFGRVLDRLRERGLYDDALVIVTADHGEGLEDGVLRHAWRFHRVLYREQIHVPLLIKAPRSRGFAGFVSDDLVRTADVLPTALELCDVASPGGLDGHSLVGLLRGEREAPRLAYADQINGYDLNAKMLKRRPQADFLYCAMDREWKLIYRPNHPDRTELYHLALDPFEETDVAAEHPRQVERLLIELARREGWVTSPFAEGEAPSAETRAILKSLGYPGDGELVDTRWGWRCPGDETIHDERGTCAETGLPMIPVRRN